MSNSADIRPSTVAAPDAQAPSKCVCSVCGTLHIKPTEPGRDLWKCKNCGAPLAIDGVLWVDVSRAPRMGREPGLSLTGIVSTILFALIGPWVIGASILMLLLYVLGYDTPETADFALGRVLPPIAIAVSLFILFGLLWPWHIGDMKRFPIPTYARSLYEIYRELGEARATLGPPYTPAQRWALVNLLLGIAAFIVAQTKSGAALVGLDADSLRIDDRFLLGAAYAAPFLLNAIRLYKNRAGVAGFGAATAARLFNSIILPWLVIAGTMAIGMVLGALALEAAGIDPNEAVSTRNKNPLASGGWVILLGAFGGFGLGMWLKDYILNPIRRRADAWSQPSAKLALARDHRAPVLLLRSFAEDQESVVLSVEDSTAERFEELIAREVTRYGPFLAVGRPGELRLGGAARAYYAGEEWRPAITDWMDKALFIVVVAGAGQGLQWELQQVVGRGHERKLIVLFPLGSLDPNATLLGLLRGTAYESTLARLDLDGARAVHLTANGDVVVICSDIEAKLRTVADASALEHLEKGRLEMLSGELKTLVNQFAPEMQAALNIAIFGVLTSARERDQESKSSDSAAATAPIEVDLLVKRGDSYFDAQDYDSAIADYTQAIERDPQRADAFHGRGLAHEKKGQRGLAIADYTRAIEIDPQKAMNAYSSRGCAYLEVGDYDPAIQDLSKVIERAPEIAMFYTLRAEAHRGKGDHQRAIGDLTKAIQIDPRNADQYGFRANAYFELRDYDKAPADCVRAIAIDPRHHLAHCVAGLALERKADFSAAIVFYRRALEINPSDADAMSGLSRLGAAPQPEP